MLLCCIRGTGRAQHHPVCHQGQPLKGEIATPQISPAKGSPEGPSPVCLLAKVHKSSPEELRLAPSISQALP